MVQRWMASAFTGFLTTGNTFRRIVGYRELWNLEAILSEAQLTPGKAVA